MDEILSVVGKGGMKGKMTLEQALETYIGSTHGEIGLQKIWAESKAQMAVVMGSRKGNDLLHCSLAQGRAGGWDVVRD